MLQPSNGIGSSAFSSKRSFVASNVSEPGVVKSLTDVPARREQHASLRVRDGPQLLGQVLALATGHLPPEHEQMFDLPGERIDQPVQVVVPLRQDERGASVSNGVQDIVADEAISTLVLGEFSVECLELHALVGFRFTRRHERRRADDDRMREGPCRRLNLGADSMPDRAALHEDDRVMTVLPSDGGGEAKHVPGPGPSCDQFEAVRRQMMALVHDEVAIVGHAVVDDAFANQALDERDVNQSSRLASSSSNSADPASWYSEERRQTLHPLIEQLLSMDEDKRADPAVGDQPRGDDRLAERGGGRQDAGVVGDQRVRGRLLVASQFAAERDVERLASAAFVARQRGCGDWRAGRADPRGTRAAERGDGDALRRRR